MAFDDGNDGSLISGQQGMICQWFAVGIICVVRCV